MVVLFTGRHDNAFSGSRVYPLLLVPSLLVQRYSLAALQGQQRFTWFNILRVASPALYSAAIVAVILSGWRNLVAVTFALVLSNVIVAVWALVIVLLRTADR